MTKAYDQLSKAYDDVARAYDFDDPLEKLRYASRASEVLSLYIEGRKVVPAVLYDTGRLHEHVGRYFLEAECEILTSEDNKIISSQSLLRAACCYSILIPLQDINGDMSPLRAREDLCQMMAEGLFLPDDEDGNKVQISPKAVFDFRIPAAEGGLPLSQFRIAASCFFGIGTEVSVQKADCWAKKAWEGRAQLCSLDAEGVMDLIHETTVRLRLGQTYKKASPHNAWGHILLNSGQAPMLQ